MDCALCISFYVEFCDFRERSVINALLTVTNRKNLGSADHLTSTAKQFESGMAGNNVTGEVNRGRLCSLPLE
jgi:hypothetical protein